MVVWWPRGTTLAPPKLQSRKVHRSLDKLLGFFALEALTEPGEQVSLVQLVELHELLQAGELGPTGVDGEAVLAQRLDLDVTHLAAEQVAEHEGVQSGQAPTHQEGAVFRGVPQQQKRRSLPLQRAVEPRLRVLRVARHGTRVWPARRRGPRKFPLPAAKLSCGHGSGLPGIVDDPSPATGEVHGDERRRLVPLGVPTWFVAVVPFRFRAASELLGEAAEPGAEVG